MNEPETFFGRFVGVYMCACVCVKTGMCFCVFKTGIKLVEPTGTQSTHTHIQICNLA